MKKILPLISFLLTITVVSAQVKIGDAPKKINPNALLELESQNKGMLIPRMTTAQRDRAFTLDVPNGLMIFNTDEKAVQVWLSDSAQWQSLSVPEDKPQQISLENHILRLSDGGTVDLSPYIDTDTDTDTDDQQLSLYGNLLSLTDGGSVDLTSLLPRSGTDSQTVSAALVGNTLQIKNQGTTQSATVDLSVYTNTDSQTLTLKDDVLSISGTNSISIAEYTNTDSQTVSVALVGNTLQIKNQGTTQSATVDLSVYTNTDTQTLAFALGGTTTQTALTLTDGGSLSLQAGNGITFAQTGTDTLKIAGGDSFYTADGGLAESRTVSLTDKNLTFIVQSQAVLFLDGGNSRVGIGTKNPETSAALQISSTTKAFLPPRMTTAQRDAIGTKVAGMVVYNTEDKALQTYDGSGWSSAGGVKVVTQSELIVATKKDGDLFFNTSDDDLYLFNNGTLKRFQSSNSSVDATVAFIWDKYNGKLLQNSGLYRDVRVTFTNGGSSSVSLTVNTTHLTFSGATGTNAITVASVTNGGTFTLAAGASRDITFVIDGNPILTASGQLVASLNNLQDSNGYTIDGGKGITIDPALADLNYSAPRDATTRAYGHILSPVTGRIWMDRSLGASRAATSGTDTNAYGYYYAWGDATADNLAGTNGIDVCPTGYRLPTKDEWCAETNNADTDCTNGDPTFGISNTNSYDLLKIALSGFSFGSGPTGSVNQGGGGYYWTSTTGWPALWALGVEPTDPNNIMIQPPDFLGAPVRCIKD